MIHIILLIAALVCFLVATISHPALARINFIALGLAFWVITALIAAIPGA